eukprot:TRINITY_DN26922_c0_g1_i3.p1 TRINITY_DN26922_c0_g1~~TRINITY_DN26922_c0_g1_i3.p1  ORF type:complete len:374 (-),score=110.43 TRINITY_DN26922_c0_g1_i3:5-1099(-)
MAAVAARRHLFRVGRAPGCSGAHLRAVAAPRVGGQLACFCSGEVQIQGASASSSLDVHKPRPVRPLTFTSDVLIFESEVDVQELVLIARRKCVAGAGLAMAGFYALLSSLSSAGGLPLELLMFLSFSAAANSYILVIMGQRLIRGLAARHVDRVTVLPTPQNSAQEQEQEEKERTAAEKLLLNLASTEERLRVTPEVRLQVRTASSERWLSLVEPLEFEDENEESGDTRKASFADLCGQLRLLDIDEEAGMCHEQALVSALKASKKVVVDERAEPRSDAGPSLEVPMGAPAPGVMLSEVMKTDVEKAAKMASSEGIADAIDNIGRRALFGGTCVLGGGLLFVVGERSRDADGVPRWNNLRRLLV